MELKVEMKELKDSVKEATEELKQIKSTVSDLWELLSKQFIYNHPARPHLYFHHLLNFCNAHLYTDHLLHP